MNDLKQQMELLTEVAQRLNEASDSLNVEIEKIEDHLKKLNLGLYASFPFTLEHNGPIYAIGYGKIGKRWGILIQSEHEEWLFTESPRRLRLASVDYLPNLITALAKEAERLISKVNQAKAFADKVLEKLST